MADVPHAAPASSAWAGTLRSLRMVGVGIGAGVIVAAVVGGAGGRIVMRILFLANDSTKGDITENGNRVGVITLGGTTSLIFFTALFLGIPAGLGYVLARRWLPGRWVSRGLVYGAFLLCVFAGGSIDADNVDFRIFGPAGLGIVLFGLLPFAFGVALAWLADRWDSYVPGIFRGLVATVTGYVVLAGLSLFGAARLAGDISELL
jgi:hypothetical protein